MTYHGDPTERQRTQQGFDRAEAVEAIVEIRRTTTTRRSSASSWDMAEFLASEVQGGPPAPRRRQLEMAQWADRDPDAPGRGGAAGPSASTTRTRPSILHLAHDLATPPERRQGSGVQLAAAVRCPTSSR